MMANDNPLEIKHNALGDDPQLVSDLLALFADMLLHRASRAKVDDPVVLREFCDRLKGLSAKIREDADECLTVAEAAAAAGRTQGSIRKWHQRHGLGTLDQRHGLLLISRAKLRDFILRRQGILPAGLR